MAATAAKATRAAKIVERMVGRTMSTKEQDDVEAQINQQVSPQAQKLSVGRIEDRVKGLRP